MSLRDDKHAWRYSDEGSLCSVAAAVIGAVGTTIGGIAQASAAKSAAKAQTQQGQAALSEQQQMFNTVYGGLQPYNAGGQSDFAAYNATGPFSFNPTEAQLEQTPGYQFTQTQGLKAVQNAAAARGLGTSGAALKGAANFATGLADTTFNQQLANQEGIYQTNANKLLGGATLGANAAAGLATAGTQTGSNIANTLTGIGNAQAAGDIGAGNAVSGIASGVASASQLPFLMNNPLFANALSTGMYH